MAEAHHELDAEMENLVEELFVDMVMPQLTVQLQSSDDSSSENEGCEMRVRILAFVEETVLQYSDKEFRKHFRLQRITVYNLIERFKTCTPTYPSGRQDTTHEKRFLLTLWYLANTETFRQCADRFNVSYSTAHKVLLCTLEFINSLIDDYIQWPNDHEAYMIKEGFRSKRGIDGIIGAIDGCHIKIRRPEEHEEDYVNRKFYHSIILQGIVDHRKRFLDVYVGEPGSMHDARVLRRSPIFARGEDPNYFHGYSILGDSAYPAYLPWLVPPFRNNGALNAEQRNFNFRHSSSRIVVEHAFGLLKSKFRRLLKFDNLKIGIIVKCVMAACVLHNISLSHDFPDVH